MSIKSSGAALALVLLAACGPEGQTAAAPADAAPFATTAPHVYIANIQDGATVSSPIRVAFGLSGYGVAPAGATTPNTGHHHLFIDTTDVVAGAPIPADDNHKHFGGGQTETVIELPPGEHTLMLVLADANHVPFSPSIQSEPITITVQ
jgi:hypothetical protein